MTSFKGQMLWDTIARGDLSAVHNVLQSGHVNLEERDQNGCTFLMTASEKGSVSIVRELLLAGVDPNAVDNENWSALLCASKEGHLEVVLELLDCHANVDHNDLCGWTPLMWASYRGKTEVVSELLEHGANPNVKADHNMTCLAWAAGRGHTEIAKMLIDKGAKINVPDKYGTTPLIWACRKGYVEIVDILLGEGASADASGMNSWTPILVSSKGGHYDVVRSLLNHDPNVNATDKDGFTSLAIAAREGYFDIVNELLLKGAYVNVTDRYGDSILIHVVKGGHVDIVRALLKKYVDVDVAGQEGKTALYWAVEKGYTEIVRLLLQSNPDLEMCTKDEDTPLLRAVRMRNEECVRLLLEKGARVSASDKRGDTALHISIRARSKRITELLLRNPRHSRLLYRLNKSGESPYSMDTSQRRGILPQIYGHGNLNATDAENLLGYEIYSSALADILSEPGLITPITMGLYAKWGSGKSFLLDKLRVEMKSFTQQNSQPEMTWSWLMAFIIILFNCVIGEAFGLGFNWKVGLAIGLVLVPLQFGFIAFIIFFTRRYDVTRLNRFGAFLGKKQTMLVMLLKMLFCIPKKRQLEEKNAWNGTFSVRFLFSDCTRLTSVGGEKSLAAMIGTLCDAVEKEYGFLITRLFRVFKPPINKSGNSRFKTMCCVPIFLVVLFLWVCLQVAVGLLVEFGVDNHLPVDIINLVIASLMGITLMANIYTWGQVFMALVLSQKYRVIHAADNIKNLKSDGFMQKLKTEVDLMSRMVNCMDSFTTNQTRLVVIVDGLDSCEQEKVLQVLDTVKSLFSDDGAPFITILAVDPHIIIKGIEQNLRSSFQDTNVNGFDYLRNVVHLPFYLQSQGLRVQQSDPPNHVEHVDSPSRPRQDSLVASVSSDSRPGIKRSVSSSQPTGGSISSSLPGMIYASSFDLSSTITKSDYFSDINPRSMRRLMNIVAVTARLLRAYNVDFKWHRLAAWINLTEQWPYRLSWIIYFFEETDVLENSASLYSLYKRIAPSIPASKEQDPLLEIDRNVRKLEASLNSKSGNFPRLNISDLRKFLPCTTNLDPYLRKLIRETQHNLERQQVELASRGGLFPPPPPVTGTLIRDVNSDRLVHQPSPGRLGTSLPPNAVTHGIYGQQPPYAGIVPYPMMPGYMQTAPVVVPSQTMLTKASASTGIKQPKDFFMNYKSLILSKCSVEDVCDLLSNLKGLSPGLLNEYKASIYENNISGLVLTMCDLSELQPVISMRFGDWQLFRSAITSLIEAETRGVDVEETLGKGDLSPASAGNVQYSFQLSNESSRSDSQSSIKGGRLSRSVTLQEPVPEETKTELQKIREKKMKRNDSIVEQLSYETAFLKSAVSGFVEESEEDEDEDNEEEVKTESSACPTITVRNTAGADFHVGATSPSSLSDNENTSTFTDQTFTLSSSSQSTQQDSASQSSSLPPATLSSSAPFTELNESTKDDDTVVSDSVSGFSYHTCTSKDLSKPVSLSDLSPFIHVLDGPKEDASPHGSSEFVPLLENSSNQSHPSSSEFLPTVSSTSVSSSCTGTALSPLAQRFKQVSELESVPSKSVSEVYQSALSRSSAIERSDSALEQELLNYPAGTLTSGHYSQQKGMSTHPDRQGDFVQHSQSTVLEMSPPDGDSSNFHHRLGVAFAQVEHVPDQENEVALDIDRETHV